MNVCLNVRRNTCPNASGAARAVFLSAAVVAMLAIGAPGLQANERLKAPHPELGRVSFETNFDAAKAKAAAEQRPIFVLFDEVPGCATVRGYGADVLSHPLIADALETEFVPAFVKNNAGADSAHTRVLRSFNEPAWNNPVARILDDSGRELTPRLAGDYSVGGTAKKMVDGLRAAHRKVPDYLALLAHEHEPTRKTETARFSMFCFWSAEVALGEIDGVLETTPGHAGGREVVDVSFDPDRVSFTTLLARARKAGVADNVVPLTSHQRTVARATGANVIAPAPIQFAASDDKYQLSRSEYRFVPMTSAQRTKVNADVGRGRNPSRWLSPRQRSLAKAIGRRVFELPFDGRRTALQKSLQPHPPLERLWDVQTAVAAPR